MGEANYNISSTPHPEDAKAAGEILVRLNELTRYLATVKKTIADGVYEVDAPGHKSMRTYKTWFAGEVYEEGAQVLVSIHPSGVGFILPPELPRTTGKTKVVQNIDDSSPPTLGQDYVRFRSDALPPFDPESND